MCVCVSTRVSVRVLASPTNPFHRLVRLFTAGCNDATDWLVSKEPGGLVLVHGVVLVVVVTVNPATGAGLAAPAAAAVDCFN